MKRAFLVALLALLGACAGPQAMHGGMQPVRVGIIAFNDFHGNLEEPSGTLALPDGAGGIRRAKAGGAARLASAVMALRSKFERSVTVSAGDLIGASPITSSLFLDEPTIGAMNRLGLDFNAVGNHEFDRGRAELLRMQNGGCEKYTQRTPCAVEPFAGANFPFLAANVSRKDGTTLFPATGLRRFGKGRNAVTVGFIGLTLKETPTLVSSEGVEGLTFTGEAEAINAAVPALKAAGADAVVVLIHQGGDATGTVDPNQCDGLEGAIVPIVSRLDPAVDVVVSGHTHKAYVCDLEGEGRAVPLLLTSAGAFGRMVTEIELVIDPSANGVLSHKAVNHVIEHDAYTPDQAIAAYVARYAEAARETAARPVGILSGPANRSADGMGGTVGNLVADAQLAATRDAGAQIALTNPFGLRAPIDPAADGKVTFAQIYAAQPFGNVLVTTTLTGAQLKAALEQGVDDAGPVQHLAPSAEFKYCVDPSRPAGQRITDMALDGEPVSPDAAYHVTVNSFLAGGGDGFTVLREGTGPTIGGNDLEALEAWIAGTATREVPVEPRVCTAGQ